MHYSRPYRFQGFPPRYDMKILVRLAFFGRDFLGTQKQKKGETIQSLFEWMLSLCYQKPVQVYICSRLDRYVNAYDYALMFEAPDNRMSIDRLKYYFRRMIKKDITIYDVREVDDDFHPRYDCSYKSYVYTIQNREVKNPLFSSIAFSPKRVLDVSKLKEAISFFVGKHDFRFFATPEGDENTIETLDYAEIVEEKGFLFIRFIGKSFLRYQVRFMVGGLLRYEEGKINQQDILDMLSSKSVKWDKLKADPYALTLERIYYPSIDKDPDYPKGVPAFFL